MLLLCIEIYTARLQAVSDCNHDVDRWSSSALFVHTNDGIMNFVLSIRSSINTSSTLRYTYIAERDLLSQQTEVADWSPTGRRAWQNADVTSSVPRSLYRHLLW